MSLAMAKLMASTGPVADRFAADKRLLTAIMGPVGSAKTTTCIRKCINAALWQNRGPDGVRRARIAVVRDTYPQLKKTVLESWFAWFPKSMGEYSGEQPMTHKIAIDVPGVGMLNIEMIFAAIGENKVEDVMRGWEITMLWLNEMDLLSREVLRIGMGRIGRYPTKPLGGCAWRGIMGDFNAPDIDNWVYPLFVDGKMGLAPEVEAELREQFDPPELFGIGYHRQPGGRSKSPLPENIQNLPSGYYAQQLIGATPSYIRRMVDNEFGAVRNGQPVYPEFADHRHVAQEKLAPIAKLPLSIGVDGGLTPAAVIGQRTSLGQIRIIDELVVFADDEETELEQIGATAFGELLRARVAERYPDMEILPPWCDPATSAGEGARGEDRSWLQLFGKAFGVKARRAPVKGNALEPRLQAVRAPMRRMVDGEPGFLLSPRCRIVRKGFNSGYVYRRTNLAGGGGRFQDEPLKNDFSHSQDAVQYLCVGLGEGGGAIGRDRLAGIDGRPRRPLVADSSYRMFGDA